MCPSSVYARCVDSNTPMKSYFFRGERALRHLCGCLDVNQSRPAVVKKHRLQSSKEKTTVKAEDIIKQRTQKSQTEGWNILRVASNLSVLTHSSQSHCSLKLTSDLSVSNGTLHHAGGSLQASSAFSSVTNTVPNPRAKLEFLLLLLFLHPKWSGGTLVVVAELC